MTAIPFSVWIVLGIVLLGLAAARFVPRFMAARRARQMADVRRAFRIEREHAEATFFQMAGASGSPRGLAWVDCDFADQVTFARDRPSGRLSAFVAVTIRFEAIAGGGMEEVEAVGNLRAATAVFHWDDGRWTTQGRVVMNLEPAEAIERFGPELERVADGAA